MNSLSSLAELLGELEGDPSRTVIRGSLNADHTTPVQRTKETFTSYPRQWCMLDIDSLPWEGDADNHQAMLDYAIQELPAEFQSVDCWYHFSANMGIKQGIRVHLWFWLDRPCSDDEMKAWLAGCPVDLSLFNPIQIHLTANPLFVDGAVDSFPNRSGLYGAGKGLSTVSVPDDLVSRTRLAQAASKQRTRGKSQVLDPKGIIRDPITGLAIDGREQLMFLLSNEVMRELVTATHKPSEDDVTEALWKRFCEEADITVVSERGAWTVADAASKAKARLKELADGTFDFISRSERTTLVAGIGTTERPKLVGSIEAQSKLNSILGGFFEGLTKGSIQRTALRLTMGAGKTTHTIDHLKTYLMDKTNQCIEVYVPRHDLIADWEESLEGINAKVIHVYPRTGGKWDEKTKEFSLPLTCQRADYVRDLEEKGHTIYGNACLSTTSGEQCSYFGSCTYLDQFRKTTDSPSTENTVRIYTHASLFLNRNELERAVRPDLVIIDEAFLSSAVSNLPAIPVSDVIQHLRTSSNASLGFDLVECLSKHHGELAYLRNNNIGSFDLNSVSLEELNPNTAFSADSTESLNVRSAKLYKTLSKLRDIAAREVEDHSRDRFEQLAFNQSKNEIVICEHKPIRVTRNAPVLYLDATADRSIIEVYLPRLEYHNIDVRQMAVVSQVFDRTGSNSFWNAKIKEEQNNLRKSVYDPQHNDISILITVLNEWVKAGERPLLVAHKGLSDQLRGHSKIDKRVAVTHFMSLRGSNAYEECSVIFITGRNQPPLDEIERQARAVFGHSDEPLGHDDIENLPLDQVDYWLSHRSPNEASAITISTFSDPRTEAVQKQVREAETVQAIARLRLVHAKYQKRVFLLSNLPVEIPVDHLIKFSDLMPDKLEMELMSKGDLPLTPLGLEKMRPDLGMSKEAIKSLYRRSKTNLPKSLILMLPNLLKSAAQLATFKAGDTRKTTHKHLFLPKDYSGEPVASLYTPWTEAEVLEHLGKDWGPDEIEDLKLEYLYESDAESSG